MTTHDWLHTKALTDAHRVALWAVALDVAFGRRAVSPKALNKVRAHLTVLTLSVSEPAQRAARAAMLARGAEAVTDDDDQDAIDGAAMLALRGCATCEGDGFLGPADEDCPVCEGKGRVTIASLRQRLGIDFCPDLDTLHFFVAGAGAHCDTWEERDGLR